MTPGSAEILDSGNADAWAGLVHRRESVAPMLVLSRKKNESIVINNDIVITIVEIRGDKVRLGIVAPKDVPVHREEVYEAIHGEKSSILPPKPTSGSIG